MCKTSILSGFFLILLFGSKYWCKEKSRIMWQINITKQDKLHD